MKNKIIPINFLLSVLFIFTFFETTFALDVPLTIRNRETTSKTLEPITSGIPFAKGVLWTPSNVRLTENGKEIPAQFRTTAHWPDGSMRWILADFQVDLQASGTTSITLQTGIPHASVSGITIDNQSSLLTVHTGASDWSFTKSQLNVANQSLQVVSSGKTYTAAPSSNTWEVEESGPMKTVIKIEGNFFNGTEQLHNNLVGFQLRLFFYRNKPGIRAQVTLRNNNSFGWNYQTPGPVMTLTGAQFGTTLLASGGSYVFGQGVERTWDLEITNSGSVSVRETRFNADGSLRNAYYYPRPVALASPLYYSSTKAWGQITPPITGAETERQKDFDLFEKLQRAKVRQQDVENPPGLTGETVWGHLYQDVESWNDYGDLRWGGSYGSLSGNHYDWPYGMMLHFLRTGNPEFFDAAFVFTRHEVDMDIYHTNENGTAYNYQKNWESRPSHETPDNIFGPGRPSHTWCQGYALYWLMTGDPRGYDGFSELIEGIRQYAYEAFWLNGYVDTSEIRFSGWFVDNLMALWRIEPNHVFSTTNYGTKTIQQAIKDIFKNVFDRETAAGNHGYIYAEDPPNPKMRQPLMNCYFIEPAIKAYLEVFRDSSDPYGSELFGLIQRMTSWLMSITYGGTSNSQGYYLPRQIPYMVNTDLSQQTDGQIPYIFMAANAAGFCYSTTGKTDYLNYMRAAFRDYIRYLGVQGGDNYIEDPAQRTATAYNSSVYTDTESKVHGWSSRYGQYYLAAEASLLYTSGTASLSRSQLNFGASQNQGASVTPSQTITLSISGYSSANWTAAANASWITISSTSGTCPSTITISVNPSGITPGTYTGNIRFSVSGAVNSPLDLPVTLTIAGIGQAPFGSFDSPDDFSTTAGSIGVTGWALDDTGVTSVQIWRNSVSGESSNLIYIGDAVFVEDTRPDVESFYPGYPFNYRAGWGYMLLTYGLPNQGMNETIVLHAIAIDREGKSTDLGTKTIYCKNSQGTVPFGAIDTPTQGGTASGDSFVNFGWVLTPPPAFIPTNGSTIYVYIDGGYKGHPVYNQPRPEIAALFPSFLNSSAAGAYFYFDTTQYSDGLHSIAWSATDNAGHSGGFGSRYFTIQNTPLSDKSNSGLPLFAPRLTNPSEIKNMKSLPAIAGPIGIRKGFNPNASYDILHPMKTKDNETVYTVSVSSMDRLEIDLRTRGFQCEAGYMKIGENEYRPLPVGSSIENGKFYWQLSPAFFGKYDLVFTSSEGTRTFEIKIIN